MAETPKQRKARERAAALKARDARKANLARRGEVTFEELVKDLIRVSQVNMGLGPSSSRDRYRRIGHFGSNVVIDQFGTHEEFRRAAGLSDSREGRKQQLLIANVRDATGRKAHAEKHLRPYQNRFNKRLPTDEIRILIGSDFHSQYTDPFALDCFIQTAEETQPNVIVLAGDVVEFNGVGRWSKRPGLNLTMQSEIDFCRKEILRPLREACPDAQIDWHLGNHEHRLERYLADNSPELAMLDCMDFGKLFSLEELEINLEFGDSFLATTAAEIRNDINDCWRVYGGCYVVTHHTPSGTNPGKAQLATYGMSGCSGHIHRQSYYIEPSLAAPYKAWLVLGMMAGHIVGRAYTSTPSKWSMGFALVTILPQKEIAFQEAGVVMDGTCLIAGMRFDETAEAQKIRAWQSENL